MSEEHRLTRLRGEWAIATWRGGKRVRRVTTGTANRTEAERLLADFITRQSRPRQITVATLWQRYRDDNAHKRIAANMAFSGKAVLPFFGDLHPDEITTELCRSYVAKRKRMGRKPGTIWTELNHLQIVLNRAKGARLILHEVVVERPPKPPPRDRRITRAEARRLLDAATYPHVALAIALMLGTGARSGAILTLTWDRVDFDRGLIHYADPDDTGRRKGRATVPMTNDVRERLLDAKAGAITDYVIEWAGRPVKSLKRGFAKAVSDAGLENVTPHVLRHTAATWMAEAGIPMTEIAAVLGHTDSRTTERIYAKFSPAYLRGAISALDMSGVPSGPDEPVGENEK